LPRPIDDQQLLFHEKAVGDDSLGTAKSQEFGEGGQHMYEQKDQVLHGQTG
jgi:hypothetical protein